MKKKLLLFIMFTTSTLLFGNKFELPIRSDVNENKQAIIFTENKGQISDQFYKPRPDVLFTGSTSGMVFYLRNNGISYQLSRVDSWKEEKDNKFNEKIKVPDQSTLYRLDINWLNVNENIRVEKCKPLEGYNNYYLEVCPTGIHNVKSYKGVTYKNIYNNIDLHYYEKDGNLKYDYIVAPKADYKQIQLEIKGAKKIEVQNDGSIIFNTPLGQIQEEAPIVYQNGKKLKSKWIKKNNVLSFDVIGYNQSLPLLIDPAIRVWGTYYGGADFEFTRSCTTDSPGNIFLAGITDSNIGTLIATIGSYQTIQAGNSDAFLVKFNSLGIRQWGTYYGGSAIDEGFSCSVDMIGNIYLVGRTGSNNSISSSGSHQVVYGGGPNDAFLAKFDTNGFRQWATYYGGAAYDCALSCKNDTYGNVYICGQTASSIGNSIATNGCHQLNWGGNTDSFLAKFNTSGVRQWGTYYGGTGNEATNYLSIDGSFNIYMTGFTEVNSGTVIATVGSHQSVFGGGAEDAFLVKFDTMGVRQWGTYYGGSGFEQGFSCTTDIAGNIYFSGFTDTGTGSVIATSASHQSIIAGNSDAFLVKFNANGIRQWGTYYGDTAFDEGASCHTDAVGNVYLGGSVLLGTGNGIATIGSHQSNYGGGSYDAFIAYFNSAGIRQWGSYYGGTGNEVIYSCSVDNFNNLYFAGITDSNVGNAIATFGSHQSTFGGGVQDAFLVKMYDCLNSSTITVNSGAICSGQSFTLTPSGANTYTFSSGTNIVSPTTTTSYSIIGTSTNSCASSNTAISFVTVNPTPTISASNGTICSGQSFIINPSGASTYTFSSGSNSVAPTVLTSYSITGTSTAGCISTTPAIVSVSVNPTPTITVNSGTTCAGQAFTLIPNGANTYTYSSGSAVVSPTTTSAYYVTATDLNGCVTLTPAISNITVNALPLINATTNNSLICSGQSAILTSNGANTYTWSTASTNTSIVISPTVNTTYTVTGTDVNGCQNFANITQSVSLCMGIVGPSGVETHAITIYPNPSTGIFNISCNAISNNIHVELVNALGQLLFDQKINSENTSIDISKYAKGIYYLKVIGSDKQEVFKLIKE
jgi:hypothetical protein